MLRSRHRFFARQLNAEFGGKSLFRHAGTSVIIGFKMESSTRGGKDKSEGTPSLYNHDGGQLVLFVGLLSTLGSKAHHRPAVPAFTNEKGRYRDQVPSPRHSRDVVRSDPARWRR